MSLLVPVCERELPFVLAGDLNVGFDHDLPDILSGPSVAEPLWDLSGRRHRASEAAGMLASVGVSVVPSSGVPTAVSACW